MAVAYVKNEHTIFAMHSRKKLTVVFAFFVGFMAVAFGRLIFLVVFQGDYYYTKANALWERERRIKAPRGTIYDRNGIELAINKPVCSVSVIHNQIRDEERVIKELSARLEVDEATVRKKVSKRSSREIIKTNVDRDVADGIRALALDGVMIDEDYKRFYPYNDLASKVLGFTGGDNQGIVGIEVYYDDVLMGTDGSINTKTDAKGIEIAGASERRIVPIAGDNLVTSIDVNIQQYITNKAIEVLESKQAKRVCILVMNPQNGEIYGLADVPEYNLNKPFELNYDYEDGEVTQDLLNQMWRCFCVNDTYEPGSTFKIVTATAGLEHQVITSNDTFYCPGYRIVEDRRIRCSKVGGHGSQDFKHGIMNSCNPVFMEVGERVGATRLYETIDRLGMFEKTGIDLPGEANSIFHKLENVGAVELATVSFGQSFQITPLQLARAVSAVVNGGTLVTPHFGVCKTDANNHIIETFSYPTKDGVISKETSETMREYLEAVVAEGTGNKAYVEGFSIGGKTATSEKLPRKTNRYISSFIGFSPANNPKVITLVLIDEPQGVYYGGTIAAPVVGDIYRNILPYLGIQKEE